jgi:hypothetical protein
MQAQSRFSSEREDEYPLRLFRPRGGFCRGRQGALDDRSGHTLKPRNIISLAGSIGHDEPGLTVAVDHNADGRNHGESDCKLALNRNGNGKGGWGHMGCVSLLSDATGAVRKYSDKNQPRNVSVKLHKARRCSRTLYDSAVIDVS